MGKQREQRKARFPFLLAKFSEGIKSEFWVEMTFSVQESEILGRRLGRSNYSKIQRAISRDNGSASNEM